MLHKIATDESLEILLFVCLPLLLLWVVLIVALVRSSRTRVKFPRFSVNISKVGSHEAYVSYCDESRRLELDAEIRRGRSFFVPEIRVRVPSDMTGPEQSVVIPNLAAGLRKLRYEYVIYRRGEPQKIPDEERNAAIAQLRQMGVEIKSAPGSGALQQAVVRDWQGNVGKQAKTMMPKLFHLMSIARGLRENIQVLARSPRAKVG